MRGKRYIVGGTLVLIGVTVGLSAVWYLHSRSLSDDAVASSGGNAIPLTISDTASKSTSSDSAQSEPGNNQNSISATNPQNNSDNSLKVGNNSQNTSNNSNSNTTSTEAPSLAELQQYDVNYKTKDAALFGELIKGDGAEATTGKTLIVNYRGWLTNGQIFDQSYPSATKKGQPFTFVMGNHQVIVGWEEGLYGMKVGGKRRIIVPPAVGYGSKTQGPIPGNSLLVFDVELLAVQ